MEKSLCSDQSARITKPVEALVSLYDLMDTAWNKIASAYQFNCSGCEDNCCKSLFFHHTHIEKSYFLQGFNQLDRTTKKNILHRAECYCKNTFPKTDEIKNLRFFCPVNENGRCVLYGYRPMICRLHGLPHELTRPGFKPVMAAGCDAGRFDGKPYIKFDRTPFYQKMAHLELSFRKAMIINGKIKETIAQMIVSQ